MKDRETRSRLSEEALVATHVPSGRAGFTLFRRFFLCLLNRRCSLSSVGLDSEGHGPSEPRPYSR